MKIRDSLGEIFTALRFGLVGLAATGVHLVVAQALLATGLAAVQTANVIGFLVALIAGFLGHHHFSFRGRAPFVRAFRRYGLIALCGFLGNNVILFTLVTTGIVGQKLALTIAILAIPAATFLASRLWGFAPVHPLPDPPGKGADQSLADQPAHRR